MDFPGAAVGDRVLPAKTDPVRFRFIAAAREQLLARFQEIRLHRTLTFDLGDAALLKPEPLFQTQVHILSDMYTTGLTGYLHPARNIDGITPDVIGVFVLTDNARHHWADVQADPESDLPSVWIAHSSNESARFKREP